MDVEVGEWGSKFEGADVRSGQLLLMLFLKTYVYISYYFLVASVVLPVQLARIALTANSNS